MAKHVTLYIFRMYQSIILFFGFRFDNVVYYDHEIKKTNGTIMA